MRLPNIHINLPETGSPADTAFPTAAHLHYLRERIPHVQAMRDAMATEEAYDLSLDQCQ